MWKNVIVFSLYIFLILHIFKKIQNYHEIYSVFLLFDKANNADRVFVGVVDQKDNEDEECLKVIFFLKTKIKLKKTIV